MVDMGRDVASIGGYTGVSLIDMGCHDVQWHTNVIRIHSNNRFFKNIVNNRPGCRI